MRLGWMALSAAVLLGAGCGALDDFEQEFTDELVIPGNPGFGTPFSADPQAFNNLDLSQSRSFQNNDVDPGDVDAIFVKSVLLEVDTGSEQLNRVSSYVERLELFVEAPGQDRKVIATLDNPPMTASAELDVDMMLNLKPYATAESMKIGATLTLPESLQQNGSFLNVTLKTTVTLLVDINILGV